ncbi:uncharacterized protein LOC129456970 [Periophthalmus magnuspinnatus]|uniref:uncharacterized protein LOC129456970 n=1 Tax=Periophthalmus magnuspinnatus TaxID=409849 RepID=UPI002436EB11|nr:uncharacterized protein LOC129456970 [Periophthalmus magnuspinnatus]
MAPKSIKTEICHILTELRGKDFEKFCFHLTDSSEEPRIRAGEVEGKSREDITTLLVSRCTGAGALHRTITTLRHIGCNEEAQELAKATRDLPPAARTRRQSMSPPVTFSPGTVTSPVEDLQQEIQTTALKKQTVTSFGPGASAAPDTHRAAAEERRSASHLNETPSVGEPGPSTVQTNGSVQTPQVKKKRPKAERKLSQQKLLFGQYKGNSFEWLLQNHVSYAGYVVATHRKERDDGSTAQSELMKNKDDLAEYVSLFPEAEEEVHFL